MAGILRFRRARGPVELAVDMAGVRLGERLIQAGVANPRVFAALAGKAGLTGRACAVVDAAEAGARLEAAAAREGVLVEVSVAAHGRWPYEDASFDVGVLDGNALLRAGEGDRLDRLNDMRRVVRPGGRVIAVRSWPAGLALRLGFIAERREPSGEAAALREAMEAAGFRPVRLLAEREGLTFVEGFRPSDDAGAGG
ncbi:MAG TPA: methyltransferase domain-containing protein [Vicinamibacterales bacterium]|nr:methyltransferase domain-containing protein [Vicinamibacterales bacterium]HOG28435.1 methyltransferase domain-containing protein [Vicinamibacterales bacterium]HPK71253.1 methyltransferase domain-containing protein [Vicinamibacterales bacterium]HPW19641.1 methyltransferase domain-containing protein [Vicinamibacterales bacterium]